VPARVRNDHANTLLQSARAPHIIARLKQQLPDERRVGPRLRLSPRQFKRRPSDIVNVRAHIRTHTHTQTARTHTHSHSHAHRHTHKRTYTHTHTHTYTHTHTHTHTRTHTHTHTCVSARQHMCFFNILSCMPTGDLSSTPLPYGSWG